MLERVSVTNFRTAVDLDLEIGPVGAFIGQPGAGKSNILGAVMLLLFPDEVVRAEDVRRGAQAVGLDATLADGRRIGLGDRADLPGAILIPAALRANGLYHTNGHGQAPFAAELFERALRESPAPRVALVRALEACAERVDDVVFLIEEPELFLSPHGHRYLYRLFQRLADGGNQTLFSTHAPGLLNVSRLDEIHLVTRDRAGITAVERLRNVNADDEFRARCEFDAERSEIFFSQAVLLVEGMTEKVAFPYAFRAMGHDIDRSAISIIDCGGKGNLPLFIEICRRARVPYVALFDSDVRGHGRPPPELLRFNRRLRRAAGRGRYVDLNPDFEGVLGIHGSSSKPERALRAMRECHAETLPTPFRHAVDLTLAAAGARASSYS